MELCEWTHRLRQLYDKATSLYAAGNRDLGSYFTRDEQAFLASIGLRPINVYDYVEDFANAGEPDWDTFLLVMAARRDHFLYEQAGQANRSVTSSEDLPARDLELGGFVWLPRIICKARCFLEGGLSTDIMYGCGGDRQFLKTHRIHPADFLRVVRASNGEDSKVIEFVRAAGRRG